MDLAFCQSEKVASLDPAQRFLFMALITGADDQGRMRAHPALIRSKVYPYDDIGLDEITDDLAAIQAIDGIILYKANGKALLQIRKWWDYNSLSIAKPSEFPPAPDWTDPLPGRRYDRSETQPLQEWIRAHAALIRLECQPWHATRARAIERDNCTCRYCGAPAGHVDHVFPKAMGGTDHLFNLVAACSACNLSKGSRPLRPDIMEGIYSANLEKAAHQDR